MGLFSRGFVVCEPSLELERTPGEAAVSIGAEGQPVMTGWPSSLSVGRAPGRALPGSRPGRRILDQGAGPSPVWSPQLGRLISKRESETMSSTRAPDPLLDLDQAPMYAPVIKDFISREENRLCPGHALPGVCEHGHRYIKTLFCGREWCPRCGALNSEVHARRIARCLTHGSTWSKPDELGRRRILRLGAGFRQFRSLGLFVFTTPKQKRLEFRSLERFAALRRDLMLLCKRHGFEGGYLRAHWRGDKSDQFAPHWNVIVPGGHMDKEKLRTLKADYARLLGVSVVDVHYSYTRKPLKMSHMIRYVTRATMTSLSDPNIAYNLKGFMSSSWWGSRAFWSGAPVWGEETALEKLESHQCPECGATIAWSKPLPMCMIHEWERSGLFRFTDLEGGYYSLSPPAPDPADYPDPGGRALLDLVTHE